MRIRACCQIFGKGILSLLMAASFFALTNAQRHPVWFLLTALWAYWAQGVALKEWSKLMKWQKLLCGAFAVVFAATTLLGGKVVVGESGFYFGKMDENYPLPFQAVDGLWVCLFMVVGLVGILSLFSLFEKLRRLAAESAPEERRLRRWFFGSWGLILLLWLPYVIAYYPGMIYLDSVVSIRYALGRIAGNHFPVMYTLWIRALLRLGNWIKDYEFGCLLYTLSQMLLISGIFAYTVRWMREKGCGKLFCALAVSFYALTPLMPMHAVSMWKDPLYAAFLLLLALHSYEIVTTRGKVLESGRMIALLALETLVICFSRNNGIYVMLAYWLTLVLAYWVLPKYKLRNWLCILVAVCCLAVYFVVTGPVYASMELEDSFVESMAIPLQQMARVAAYQGNLTVAQQTFLSELLTSNDYAGIYTPMCVDNLKWDSAFNKFFLGYDKLYSFRTWLEIGRKNIGLYLEAYLLQTYQLWSIGDMQRNLVPNGGTHLMTNQLEEHGIQIRDLSKEWFHTSWREMLPVDSHFLSTGVIAWLHFAVGLILLLRKKKGYLLVLSPMILSWMTLLISTPLVDWRRYVLASIYALPLVLALTLLTRSGGGGQASEALYIPQP